MAFSWSSFGKIISFLFDTPANGAESIQNQHTTNVQGSGFSLGNFGGWSNSFGTSLLNNFARRGITQMRSGIMNKHAVGDAAGIYSYVFTDGGISAASDEGATAITAQCIENQGYFHGTVSATTGTGDLAPVLAFTSGNPWTTDGGYLLNITKGTLAGGLAGFSSPLSLTTNAGVVATFLNSLPVTAVSLPVSTAIGIATAAIANPGTVADTPLTTVVTVDLCQIAGVFQPFVVGDVVTVAGISYPEQSILTAVTTPTGTHQQTLTMKLRNPNSQAVVFQGGIQGQYISFDANLALSGMRSSYFAFGSLTGTDLIYGNQVGGSLVGQTLPQAGCEAAQHTGTGSGFHLFPGAEVVANTDQGFACKIEQNGVAWTVSDVVECTHFPTFGGATAFFVHEQFTPSNSESGMAGLLIFMDGPGIAGGNTFGARIQNLQSAAVYSGSGGPLVPPVGLGLLGTWSHGIYFEKAPDLPGNAVIFVQNNNAAGSGFVNVISLDFHIGGNLVFDVPNGRWHVDLMDSNLYSISGVPGLTTTITTAKLTTGGSNGSMTFAGGILLAQTPAT